MPKEGCGPLWKPRRNCPALASFKESIEKLRSWIEEDNRPFALGGQIGSGKSTVINKAFLDSSKNPDIVLHLDQGVLNLDTGDFWGIALSEFIKVALLQSVDLSFCKMPEELGGYQSNQWEALYDGLAPKDYSMENFATKVSLRKKIAHNTPYVRSVVSEIGKRIEKSLGRPVFVFASGIDKFDPASAAFFSMQEVISALAQFKTLYEVNAVHLFYKFSADSFLSERLFLSVAEQDAIIEMLSKRMGGYAKPIYQELVDLAEWSGGNPRQAIRLLTYFETARKNPKRSRAECIIIAIRDTLKDFFSFSPKPSKDLIRTIKRSGRIESSLFSLPNDKDTARMALYGNWIFIKQLLDDASWSAEINPLIKAAFDESPMPEEPETNLLKKYAADVDISAIGLNLNPIDETTGKMKSGEKLLWEYVASGVEQPFHTNLGEIFDVLSGALLSKDRASRAIIAYKDKNVLEAARAYLFAKANTYEYQRCLHFELEGGKDKMPLKKLEEILSYDTDIYSTEFLGEWKEEQLLSLDKQRDRFIDYQMLWWIPFEVLNKYLPYWVQLRQLFEVFVLEDELLGSISTQEIEADLAFFEELVDVEESAEANVVTNLKTVLEYLKRVREGENHG